jgi:HAMP domain-containing protein
MADGGWLVAGMMAHQPTIQVAAEIENLKSEIFNLKSSI